MKRRITRCARGGVATRTLLGSVLLVGSVACESDSPTASGLPPAIALSDSTAAFAADQGGPSPVVQVVAVANGGGGTLDGLASSVAYDAGQPTGWLAATLTATSAPASLTLTATTGAVPAGTYDAAVILSAAGVAPDTVDVTLVVDLGAAPTIVVTSPVRAAMLQAGTLASSDVQITGEACHPSVPIASLQVNGVTIAVGGTSLCAPFAVTQSSAWGLSTIVVEAENAYGRGTRHVQSYLRSPTYLPVAYTPSAAARVPRGFYAQLNQSVLDDGNRSDLDDLASIAQAVLNGFNVNSGLPTTLARNPSNAGALISYDCFLLGTRQNPATGIRVNRTGGFSTGARSLGYVRAYSTGLEIAATVPTLNLPLRVDGWADWQCVPPFTTQATQSGVVSATRLETWNRFALSTGSGITVTSSSATANLVGAAVDVDWGALDFLDFLVNGTVQLLLAVVEDYMEAPVAQSLSASMVQIVDGFLSSFRVDASASVNGAAVSYLAEIDSAAVGGTYPSGFAQLGLATQVRPTVLPVGSAPPLGAIRAASPPPAFNAAGYDMGIAVADDLINQLLWSAWQAGSFDVSDVEAFTGATYPGLGGSTDALLPPVAAPGTASRMIDFQWGDMIFDGTADPAEFGLPGSRTGGPVPFQAYVSAVVRLDIEFDGAGNRLRASNLEPEVHVQVVPTATSPLDEVALANAVASAMADALVLMAEQSVFAVDVPVLAIGGLTGVPSGTVLRLTQASVDRAGRYSRLTGSVGN